MNIINTVTDALPICAVMARYDGIYSPVQLPSAASPVLYTKLPAPPLARRKRRPQAEQSDLQPIAKVQKLFPETAKAGDDISNTTTQPQLTNS